MAGGVVGESLCADFETSASHMIIYGGNFIDFNMDELKNCARNLKWIDLRDSTVRKVHCAPGVQILFDCSVEGGGVCPFAGRGTCCCEREMTRLAKTCFLDKVKKIQFKIGFLLDLKNVF